MTFKKKMFSFPSTGEGEVICLLIRKEARGRDEMKNRGDVSEGRKGKWRQRQALIAEG